MGLTNGMRPRADRCRDEFGFPFAQLACLVAIVARHRLGLTTCRRDVHDFLIKEEGIYADFTILRRLQMIRLVRREGNRGYVEPTSIGLARVGSAGRTVAA